MYLTGKFNLYDTDYHLVVCSLLTKTTWYLFSDVHPEDYFKPFNEKRFFNINLLANKNSLEEAKGFCVGALLLAGGKPDKSYKSTNILDIVFDNYVSAKNYGYTKDEILSNGVSFEGKRLETTLWMRSSEAFIKETKLGSSLQELHFKYGSFELSLMEVSGLKYLNLDFQKIQSTDVSKSSSILNINKITIETLANLMDISHYYDLESGKFIKNYTNVYTKKDLEVNVINKLVKVIHKAMETGEKALIGLDFETDGLGMYDYPEGHPDKSKAVSVQLSWEDNQGVDIYLDMEYFDNVDRDYCLKRLSDLFRWERGKFGFELFYDDEGNEKPSHIILDRDAYLVGGHNVNFDSRCFRRHGYEMFFDEDTLQMAFTLAPTSFKVSKDLKSLTKFFLGVEPPELKTILGKGNEDKFRYLTDKRVADIYGCSDVDMFRQVWRELKDLMDDTDKRLYNGYKKFDVYIINVLAEAEFRGIRTDRKFIKEQSDQIATDLKILEEKIFEFTGKLLLLRSSKALNKPITEEDFNNARHEFKITGKDLLDVVYNKLGYPVKVLTKSGNPALNSYAIDKLLYYTTSKPTGLLKHDVLSCTSTEEEPVVLIDAEKFNSYKYPLAYLLKQYRTLTKEYTGYYKPFSEIGEHSKIFKGFKTTNIETRRISNPVQTVKKGIKKCILSYGEDYYLVDWDLAQIELRMFTSMAKDQVMIDRMMDGDTDYHTENGATVFGMQPHLLPKNLRSRAKSVGFGVPYGLSAKALCEWMFTVVNQKNMMLTNEVLDIYEKKNHLSMSLLKSFRNKANEDAYMSPRLRKFLNIAPDAPVAMIRNLNGFYRYQDMTKIRGDKGKTASIERAFGNFPIQSFAADYFKYLIIRFDKRLRKEGIKDKVFLHMTIHDEILFSVHKSIDPNFLCKIVKEECMLRLKGHTNYFLGLNFGKNWLECKQDEAELPVKFLQRTCKAYDEGLIPKVEWCDNPADYYAPKIVEFKKDRIVECLADYVPNVKEKLPLDGLWDKFENYTVRSYFYSLPMAYTPMQKYDEDKGKLVVDKKGKPVYDSDDRALSSLLYVLKERGLESTIIEFEGKQFTLDKFIKYRQSLSDDILNKYSGLGIDVELDLDYMSEEEEVNSYINPEFWSFDDAESAEDVFFYAQDEFDEFEEKVNELLKFQTDAYEYISNIGKTKILMVKGYDLAQKLEVILAKYKNPNGTRVRIDYGGCVETPAVKYNLPDDFDLNLLIKDLHSKTS